jgi:hypothetical protein
MVIAWQVEKQTAKKNGVRLDFPQFLKLGKI